MGVKGLTRVIVDNAPGAIRENEIKNYFGRKVAIDASVSLYQFLVAIRSDDNQNLVNDAGETTSHLQGMFYRTIRLVTNGIKPVFIFDGKPPDMKAAELAQRRAKREEAEEAKKKAVEEGDTEMVTKLTKRTVRVTKQHNEECQKLLRLMGVPVIEATCEADSLCANLVKAKKVYAVGSEDMDALPLGTGVLLRNLTFSAARKMPIKEIHLDRVLEGFEMTFEQFVDLCILLGCDYCPGIRGIGGKTAYKLIKEHGTIEKVLENLNKDKYTIPEGYPYETARHMFFHPEVQDVADIDLKWTEPDEAGLIKFLVEEKQFSIDRVKGGVAKLNKARGKGTQERLTSFFTLVQPPAGSKRKSKDDKKGKGKGKAKKARKK